MTLGTTGIAFTSGESLTVEHCNIMNFSSYGINFQPAVRANLVVADSNIENAAGGAVISSAGGGGINRVVIARSNLHRSAFGVASGTNSSVQVWQSSIGPNAGAGVIASGTSAQAGVDQSTITNNQVAGVQATSGGTVQLSNNSITYNNGPAMQASGGQILSFGNNWVVGNMPDGTRSGTIMPQ